MKPSLRFEIFKRDDFACRYCGQTPPAAILEVDHIIPVSSGGDDDPANLVTACFLCNRGKGVRLLSEVPQDRSVAEKAAEIAEQELQITAYNHWRAQQKAREDRELDELHALWCTRWQDSRWWKRHEVRAFLKKLGRVDLEEIIETVNEQTRKQESCSWVESAWRFFCYLCWKRIKGDG